METKKISKKGIVKTLRSYDVTAICKLYKDIFGEVPAEIRRMGGEDIRCLDGFKVYKWAADYATSRKMDSMLYSTLSRASHHWKYSIYEESYVYGKHGSFKPTDKQYVVNELLKNCANPESPYAKRPMYGRTHLYFCSPVYGHSDYNKWCAMPIEGNERFVELIISVADKYFGPVYDK